MQRSGLWQQIADNLNATDKPRFLVDKKAVRDHILVLIDRFKRKEAQEARESGTCQEHPELDNAVEQVIAMESTESEETEDMNAKKLQDRAKAEAMKNKTGQWPVNSCLAACFSISVYNAHDMIKRSHGRISGKNFE